MAKRFKEGEIVKILKEAEELGNVRDVIRKHNVSEQSFYRWRQKYLDNLLFFESLSHNPSSLLKSNISTGRKSWAGHYANGWFTSRNDLHMSSNSPHQSH